MTRVSGTPIEIRVSQPTASGSDEEPSFPPYDGPAFFSFGFRPFFLGAALFAGAAVPLWILILTGTISVNLLYSSREWHVHEMLFGFLPAVMAGFLLTAIPNWTGRMPLRGIPLASLWVLWLAGRLVAAISMPSPWIAAVIDAGFLIALAAFIWREIAASGNWSRSPIGLLIGLYAGANIGFHALALRGGQTDVPERVAVSILLVLLTVIGGRVTPAFTSDYLAGQRITARPPSFSLVDRVSMLLVPVAGLAWILQPEGQAAAALLIAAGGVNLVRLWRWQGWMAWREPLVFILTVGYGWMAMSLLALGGSALGLLPAANAVHVLTTGAVGTMTLAIMTRASLGHTGRPRHADLITLVIYVLVNFGGIVRVLAPDAPTGLMHLLLGLAAIGWSGAYLLFALDYGRILVSPNVEG
jgi:uncharacterized protein involved in response to NO